MDHKVEIKEEPVWLEGTASTSFDNSEPVSEMIHLKEETKSELAEPGQTKVNTFEPFADVKDEVFVEEPTVGQLVSYFKEEDNVENVGESTSSPLVSCDSCCNDLGIGNGLMCNLPPDAGERPYRSNTSNQHLPLYSTERPFQHKECNSTLSLKPNVERKMLPIGYKSHLRYLLTSHTSKRTYSCHKCRKEFYQNVTGKSHMVTESSQRSHICNECGKIFSRKRYLYRHVLTHTGGQRHVCNNCGKTFSMKIYLLRHMVFHSGKRSHICDECGKTFYLKSSLKRHTLTHFGQRTHACNKCGKRFFLSSTLKFHMITHSGEQPHVCNKCGNTFARKYSLKRHMLVHSRDSGPNS